MDMITPEQCRAARAYLGWTQRELAEKANVKRNTVSNLERGEHSATLTSLRYIRYALESGGIGFLENGGIVPLNKRK